MPSRKQRRRRAKERRHEYEYVYVDDEGQEVEVDDEDEIAPKASTKASAKDSAKPRGGRSGRAGRPIEPPSWRRVGRRALFLGPALLLIMYFLKPKDANSAVVVGQAIFFLAVFLPFSYLMDSMLYRSHLKRTGQAQAPRRRPGKEPKPKT